MNKNYKIEGNKLIDLFMANFEEHESDRERIKYDLLVKEHEPRNYDEDWELLVPAAKRVREVINVELSINNYEVVREMDLTLSPYEYSKEQVHGGIVEFIQWYNENELQ